MWPRDVITPAICRPLQFKKSTKPQLKKTVANSQFRYNKMHGVLKLTLSDGGYAWKFIAVSGAVIDAGQSTCHW